MQSSITMWCVGLFFVILLAFLCLLYKPHTSQCLLPLQYYTYHRLILCCFLLLSYFLSFIEPCVFIGLHSFFSPRSSFQSKGKSIALIHSGQPSYPSFLSSRIALFFTLQLTLLRSNLSKCSALSLASLLLFWPSYFFPSWAAVPRPPLVKVRASRD